MFIFLIILTYLPFRYHFTTESGLTGDERKFYVIPDLTTMKVDGDRLQFYGSIKRGEQEENLVFFYRLQSEEEKNKYINYSKPVPLIVEGQLEAPQSQSNFHQFDYKEYLNRRHIFWTLEVSLIQGGQSSVIPWKLRWSSWRASLTYWVKEHIPGLTGDYILTLLLADSQYMDENIRGQYSKLGIIHLLSISGMHIHFFIDKIRYALLRVGVNKEWIPFIFIFTLPFYGLLLGFGVSIFRAVVQNILKSLNSISGRPLTTLDIWSITLVLFLCFRPLLVVEAGFQFSFSLSLFLILFSQSEFNRKIPEKYENMVLTSFISILSLPILTYHYFEFPWFTTLANLIFVPLFSLLILPGLTCIFLFSFLFSKTSIFLILVKYSNVFLEILEKFIHTLSALPFINIVTGRLSLPMFLVLCISVYFFLYSMNEAKSHRIILFVLSSTFIAFSLVSNHIIWKDEVLMIDIGQGDSFLIRKKEGQKNILIDTGGGLSFEKKEWQTRKKTYSVGRDILTPVLKSEGVSVLDKVILTHADADHAGEVYTISEEIRIKKLLASEQTLKSPSVKEQWLGLKHQQDTKISVIPSASNHSTKINQLGWVLWPIEKNNEDENEHSLVIYAKISNDYWLFTGDISQQAERQLIELYPNLKVDILKVGHHGSRTSTAPKFLQAIQAKKALISAGRNNRFQHPHEEVLDALRKEDIEIYRTDQEGAIRFVYSSGEKNPHIESVREGDRK